MATRRTLIVRYARFAPIIFATALMASLLIGNGCGQGLLALATATGSTTSTPTPGVGQFTYASNFNDAEISEFSRNVTTGALTFVGQVTAGAAGGPMGITTSPNGAFLYVANQKDGNIYEFVVAANGGLDPISGSPSIAGGGGPQMIAIDPTGAWLYVTSLAGRGKNAGVFEFSIDSGTGALTAIGQVTGLSVPFGVTALALSVGEVVYVADNGAGLIYTFVINSNGTLSQLGSAVQSIGTSFGSPALMTIASGTFLFVDDTVQGVVSELSIAANGQLTFGGNFGSQQDSKPIGIGMATNSGNNYVFTANVVGDFVQPFSQSSGALTPLGATTVTGAPTGLIADSQGEFVYTGNSGNGTITELEINGSCGQPLCVVDTFNAESPANSKAGTQFLTFAQ